MTAKTIQIAPTAVGDVTDETLKLGPPRLLAFLEGVSDPAIRTLFAPLGWSDERLDQAWALLSELRAANKIPATPVSDPISDAIAACEACQATGLVRARAMTQLSFPEQAAFVFSDFVPGKGAAAVLNVETFLERCKELEGGAERKSTRKADHEALALIEETAIGKEEQKRLQRLVDIAQSVSPLRAPHVDAATAKRDEVLRKIHAWITAWTDMARTVVTRRDHMIKLGIAKRRSHKAKGAVVTPPPPAVTPVVVAPTPITPPAPQPSVITEEVAPESRAA